MTCRKILLCLTHVTAALTYQSRRLVAVGLPTPIGHVRTVEWCKDGVPGAIQRTLTQLFNNRLKVSQAQHVRDTYFRNSTHFHWNPPPPYSPYDAFPSAWVSQLKAGDMSRKVYEEEIEDNNLLSLTRMLPVLKDILDLPSNSTVGNKLATFASRVCRLMDSELDATSQIKGLSLEDARLQPSPYSCAVIDAIESGIACGVSPIKASKEDACTVLPRNLQLFNFPDEECRPIDDTLDRSSLPPTFHFTDAGLSLPLALTELRSESGLPKFIPVDVRQREMLTYLTLYRAMQMIYKTREIGFNPQCPNVNPFQEVELIPGWRTDLTLSLAQAVSSAGTNSTRKTPPTPKWKGKPNLSPRSWLGGLLPLRPLTWTPWSLPQSWTRSNNPLFSAIVAVLTFLNSNRDPELAYDRALELWDQFWDTQTQTAARNALADLQALLTDPINALRAAEDIRQVLAQFAGESSKGWLGFDPTGFLGFDPTAYLPKSLDPREIVHILTKLAYETRFQTTAEIPEAIHIPTLFVSSRRSMPCDIAIGIRGTSSFAEWILDFNFWAVPDAHGNMVHQGVYSIVNVFWPTLQHHVVAHSAKHQCTCDNTSLTFYGHSLGGGVAQQLALRFAQMTNHTSCPVRINNVSFAPLKQMTKSAMEEFQHIVNARTILDLNDPLTYLPCHTGNSKNGYARCGRDHVGFPGQGRDLFTEHPALLFLDVDYEALRPVPTTTGSTLFPQKVVDEDGRVSKEFVASVLNAIMPSKLAAQLPSPKAIVAAHVCAHSCALSAACGERSLFRWWCGECPADD